MGQESLPYRKATITGEGALYRMHIVPYNHTKIVLYTMYTQDLLYCIDTNEVRIKRSRSAGKQVT